MICHQAQSSRSACRPRTAAWAGLAALALAMGAGCRGGAEEPGPPPIQPYPGFFQGRLGEDVYLFASLLEKLEFDRDPASLPYVEFISRTGQRVLISSRQPELVPRIEVGYEKAVDTVLQRVADPDAPRADQPPAIAETTAPKQAPDQPETPPATQPREGAVPREQLGPAGDQRPQPQ